MASQKMPRMFQAGELAFLQKARVGRLATADARGRPAVIPCCFAVVGEQNPVVVSVLDEKPKRVDDSDLARVRHIRERPDVALVVDHYSEDWSELAFVQVKGTARLVRPGASGHAEAIRTLRDKYAQYRAMAIEERPVIIIDPSRVSSWRGDGGRFDDDDGDV